MDQFNKYEISEMLYESDKTRVYRARSTENRNPYILKMLNRSSSSHVDSSNLKREFSILSDLQSDLIVKSYGLEKFENAFFMVLEDFGGQSVSRIMKDQRIDISKFLELSIQIVDALNVIHRNHIIHKDINPSNIIWNRQTDVVKIVDFDISTRLSSEQFELKTPELIEGTLQYISPEQTGRINRSVDYRTDYYSLGVTFYQMLTGELPFNGQDAMEIIHSHIARTPLAPQACCNSVPEALSKIIMKMIEKDPEFRYQSLAGIKTDLKNVQAMFIEKRLDEPYDVGTYDYSSRFHVPENLYGRETEIKTLLNIYQKACEEDSQILLVSGFSGVGKSALVKEIHRPIVERKGLFIEGKFDQFTKDVPYSAIAQAFRELVIQILKYPKNKMDVYKEKIQSAVQPNGILLTALIPELESVIGEQPPVPTLGPAEAQNRFLYVFGNFVKVFAREEQPLTIFLDDLQWSDMPTLKLIDSILSTKSIRHLLFIGAYRDNEVNSGHPLMVYIHEMSQHKAVQDLQVKPLSNSIINTIVADTLRNATTDTKLLSHWIYQKTNGNPFFTKELLNGLYKDGHFHYNQDESKWSWDLNTIHTINMTDNVVDYVIQQFSLLSDKSLDILKLASCIGNYFDLTTLAFLAQLDQKKTGALLWDSTVHHFIVPLDENYRLTPFISDEDTVTNIRYRFSHDRIQQAANHLIEADLKKKIHLKMGRMLYQNTSANHLDQHIIDIVRHYNQGIEFVTDPKERVEVSRLNLRAGDKAKNASAFKPAMIYYANGIDLMENPWITDYRFAFEIFLKHTEVAYLCGEHDIAERSAETILKYAKTAYEKAELRMIQLSQYDFFGKSDEAINMGILGLELLGVKIPFQPSKQVLIKELLITKAKLTNKSIEYLYEREEIKDKEVLLRIKLLLAFIPPAYLTGKGELFALVVLKAMSLVLKHGNSPESAAVYSGYQVLMAGFGDYKKAYAFGKLSVQLSRKYGENKWYCLIQTLYGLYGFSWFEPWNQFKKLFKESIEIGMNIGDLLYSSMACSYVYIWDPELSLQEIVSQMEKLIPLVEESGYDKALMQMQIGFYSHVNLAGRSNSNRSLDTKDFSEEQLIQKLDALNYDSGYRMFYGFKVQLHYLYGDFEDAYQAMLESEKHMPLAGTPYAVNSVFFSFLTLAAIIQSRQDPRWNRLTKAYKHILKWSKTCPENFRQYKYIADAEIQRLQGNTKDAIEFYNKAIKEAQHMNHLRNTALFNEIAGRFFIQSGMDKVALAYLDEARFNYRLWGAFRKVKHFEKEFKQLFLSFGHNNVVKNQNVTSYIRSETSSSTAANLLDTQSIIKASRAISQEIVREKLVKKILNITIENAGAQKGCILFERNGQLFIEAMGHIDFEDIEVLQSIPIQTLNEKTGKPFVSNAIVNFVYRTKQNVVIKDALEDDTFADDSYILKTKPKSILCIPVLIQNSFKAILYFENNLAPGAFTPERLETLKVIATQTAISLENADLYAHLEDKVRDRTCQLEEMTEQLRKLSVTDQLTGLHNRRKIDEVLEYEFNKAKRYKRPLSIIILDIDKFKKVNDTYGHQMGDLILVQFSTILKDHIRSADTLGRWGGEEFLIICPETDAYKAMTLAEHLRSMIDNYSFSEGVHVTSSFGVSQLKHPADTISDFLKRADNCLYEAKELGRNQVYLEPEMYSFDTERTD